MKVIERHRVTVDDCEYILSEGWGGDTPYRFEIIEGADWWDIFLSHKELIFLYGFLRDGITSLNSPKYKEEILNGMKEYDDSDLKSCPFCGSDTMSVDLCKLKDMYSVICTDCFSSSGNEYDRDRAKMLWNMRSTDEL